MLFVIDSEYAFAGIVVERDVVVKAAPIFKYMKGWPLSKVKQYCKEKKWIIKHVENSNSY